MRTEPAADPIAAFNEQHPPRVRPPAEPIRFAGGPAPADLSALASSRPVPFRSTYSTRTGHRRSWRGESRNPR